MRTTAKLVLAAAAATGLLLGAQGLASADENPFWQQPEQQEQQQPQQEQQPQQQQQPQQENASNDDNQGAQNEAQQDISPSAWALWGAWEQ